MSKKHFEAIARILAQYNIVNPAMGFDEGYSSAANGITEAMADYFAQQNPRFDRERFLAACGF